MEINHAYEVADLIYEEYEETLYNMIKDVQDKKDGSLLKLANQLTETKKWTDQITSELQA